MSNVEQHVDVEVPVRTAYDQWTQFTEFPRFMEGVERIDQLTDTRTHWVTKIADVTREFDAEITEQTPDQRIAWKAVDGATNAGVVTFHRLEEGKTRVMLQLDFEPESVLENLGDKLGVVSRRATGDLENFKKFIESRGTQSGAWRGEVSQDPTS